VSTGTVFSVLTPSGRGAVAVIAVAGPDAVQAIASFFHAKNGKALSEQPITRIVYGNWRSDGEDLIICRRDADCLEIHCHGGVQAVATIAGDLASAGCQEIPWQKWLACNDSCPLRVESQIALAQAESTRTALILLDQYHGALRGELAEIVGLMQTNCEAAQQRLKVLLATAELGLHLTRPWQVVIAGRPNVGKSSLINALMGYQRAIVFDQPGTTRDVVTASTVIDGWPISLSDTAGLHDSNDELEAAGIGLAKERLARADLVVWVLDATEVVGNLFAVMSEQIEELGLALPAKRLVVLNKVDRATGTVVPQGAIATSATAGLGIEALLAAISATLMPSVPNAGAAVVFTEQQRESLQAALAACASQDRSAAVERLHGLIGEVG
jgi:tRNA modification GTPase